MARKKTRRTIRKARFGALVAICAALTACTGTEAENARSVPLSGTETGVEPTPEHSFVQKELVDGADSSTEGEIGGYDFRNHTFPLPRGWHHADGKEITLTEGKRRTTEEKIGMEYLTAKYFDVTGDGIDEAAVILQIRTGGSAIPQIVYIFEWKDSAPELLWYFRTGDRSDGGLKRIYVDNGDLIVELFGQDRYIFNQMETLKITGDEVQLCCPTHFTRTRYRRNGNTFSIEGDRLTYSLTNINAEPAANLGEVRSKEESESKR